MSRYIDADFILDGIKSDRALIKDGQMDSYKEHYLSFLEKCVELTPSIDLADYVPKEFHDKTCEAMAKRHQEEIADILERADADRPQGEWIEFDTKWGRSLYYCTNCMETSEVPTAFGKPLYDFCPNCGADMREREGE